MREKDKSKWLWCAILAAPVCDDEHDGCPMSEWDHVFSVVFG